MILPLQKVGYHFFSSCNLSVYNCISVYLINLNINILFNKCNMIEENPVVTNTVLLSNHYYETTKSLSALPPRQKTWENWSLIVMWSMISFQNTYKPLSLLVGALKTIWHWPFFLSSRSFEPIKLLSSDVPCFKSRIPSANTQQPSTIFTLY